MNADEFRDYIPGFIFYKYYSEKMELYADSLLGGDRTTYQSVQETTSKAAKIITTLVLSSVIPETGSCGIRRPLRLLLEEV